MTNVSCQDILAHGETVLRNVSLIDESVIIRTTEHYYLSQTKHQGLPQHRRLPLALNKVNHRVLCALAHEILPRQGA